MKVNSARAISGQVLTKDGARRIAVNIAKLPKLLSRHKTWGVGENSIGIRFSWRSFQTGARRIAVNIAARRC